LTETEWQGRWWLRINGSIAHSITSFHYGTQKYSNKLWQLACNCVLCVPKKVTVEWSGGWWKKAVDKLLWEVQVGFCWSRSYTNQIFVSRRSLGNALEYHHSLVINSLDFEKVSYSMDEECLWNIVAAFCMPNKIMKVTESLCKKQILRKTWLSFFQSEQELKLIHTTCTYSPYIWAIFTARTYGCILDTRPYVSKNAPIRKAHTDRP